MVPLISYRAVDHGHLSRSAFFRSLDVAMAEFLRAHFKECNEVSFFIWGGAAAEFLLTSTGQTDCHFSTHDIEICLTKHGDLYHPEDQLLDLDCRLAVNPGIALHIGGLSITRLHSGVGLNTFQSTRIGLPDGDLLLNNVALSYERARERWVFIHSGVLEESLNGGLSFEIGRAHV